MEDSDFRCKRTHLVVHKVTVVQCVKLFSLRIINYVGAGRKNPIQSALASAYVCMVTTQ